MKKVFLFILLFFSLTCKEGSIIIISPEEKNPFIVKDIFEEEKIYDEIIIEEYFKEENEGFEDFKKEDIEIFKEEEISEGCVPNNDGVITADEILIVLGTFIKSTVNKYATEVKIPSLEGTKKDNVLQWDFSKIDLSNDEVVDDFIKPLGEFWFEKYFPSDAYVAPIEIRKGDLGVYRKTKLGLYLLGVASIEEGKTALVYKNPPMILKFPLKEGLSYKTSNTEAQGFFEYKEYPQDYGVLGKVQIFHTYHFSVDAKGFVLVPAGKFYSLRILVELKMEVKNSLNPFSLWTENYKIYDFITECIGLVAKIKSREGEKEKLFKIATEYKRLGF